MLIASTDSLQKRDWMDQAKPQITTNVILVDGTTAPGFMASIKLQEQLRPYTKPTEVFQ